MLEWLEHSRWIYTALVGAVAVERLVEMRISRRNTSRAIEHGAVEVGAAHYPFMVTLHTSFLVSCLIEVWWLDRALRPSWAIAMTVLLAATMALRYWVVATLGRRWTTRVVCHPGLPVIDHGPYRIMRHPNYLAVVLELIALPLIHGAWLTAIVFSLANAWMLRVRIAVEERALGRYSSYPELLGDRRRILPGRR